MPAIHIDESRWPIVLITYIGVARDAEFADHLARLDELLARGGRTVTVVDARHAGVNSQAQRAAIVRWMKQNDARLRAQVLGLAYVFSSPLMRVIIQGLLMLYRMPAPTMIFSSLAEAMAWAEERVAAARPSAMPRA